MTDIKSMFESIKESLNNEKQTSGGSFKNFLKMEVGKTYLVRFIPNVNDPKATFFHYAHHGWTSSSTGQYIDATCLRTFNERCPICEARFKLYKTKKEEDKELAYTLRSYDKHLVNVYVISDPTTPENEGTIKILRFGKRIYDKVLAATEGDDADEFGHRIYDLTENGCNFKIKVESSSEGKSKFTNYNNSRFTAPSAIPDMTSSKIKEVYNSIFDLSTMIEVKSEDEVTKLLNDHSDLNTEGLKLSKKKAELQDDKGDEKNIDNTEVEDEIPMGDSTPPKTSKTKQSSTQEDKINNLLAELDDL